MERRVFAVFALLAGLFLGLIGNILFYGHVLGLSFPLFVAIGTAMLLASARVAGQRLQVRNLWPLLPMGFFAAMVAVRADPLVTILNLMAVIALGALVVHYLPLEQHPDEAPLSEVISGAVTAGMHTWGTPGEELRDAYNWMKDQHINERKQLLAVGRGILIAIPVLGVFALLLASADLVFANYLEQIAHLFQFDSAPDLVVRLGFTGVIGWAAAGAIAYGVARRTPAAPQGAAEMCIDDVPSEDVETPRKRTGRPRFSLGMVEATIILGGVDLMFAVFVAIQFAYFFGGRTNIGTNGLTFAQYARRGFFELVAVSVLTLGLALLLDYVTIRHSREQHFLFRMLSIIIVVLTGVMLVSAAQRMSLYEEAYGFTHLRVYTHVFMLWLGVLFGFFLLALFRVRVHVFSLGVLLAMIGYLGTINLINVDRYIAERNIARYYNGHELDVTFLSVLSADAAPPILDLYTATETTDTNTHARVGQVLARQLYHLDSMLGDETTFFEANLSRDSSRAALAAVADTLPNSWPSSWDR